ncbi:hypothetical protein WJ12_23725 [Burkholderia seminalis]|nr:hypothetical protein WJ12_23725 [Burkholderia seminalis]
MTGSCLWSTAFAQSSVTLYGILDTGVELVTHANTNGNRVVRMPSITGQIPSRWGFRGKEDLGGGISAIFALENGFNVSSGTLNQGGRLFGRQAWVGVQGPFGTFTFGRQYTMTFWAIQDADVLGPDVYNGVGSFDLAIPNARSDNTIAWKGTFAGVTAGATYSFGRDAGGNSPGQGSCVGSVAGSYMDCKEWSVMLRYDVPNFGVAAAYDEQRGGNQAAANFFNGVAPFPLTQSGDKDIRMQLNGYAIAGQLKIGAGWLGRRVETVSTTVPDVHSDQFYLTAAYLFTPAVNVDGGVFRILNATQNARGTIVTLRTTYFMSKRTAMYFQGGYLFNSPHARYTVSQGGGGTTPGAGMGQLGLMAGIRQMF